MVYKGAVYEEPTRQQGNVTGIKIFGKICAAMQLFIQKLLRRKIAMQNTPQSRKILAVYYSEVLRGRNLKISQT